MDVSFLDSRVARDTAEPHRLAGSPPLDARPDESFADHLQSESPAATEESPEGATSSMAASLGSDESSSPDQDPPPDQDDETLASRDAAAAATPTGLRDRAETQFVERPAAAGRESRVNLPGGSSSSRYDLASPSRSRIDRRHTPLPILRSPSTGKRHRHNTSRTPVPSRRPSNFRPRPQRSRRSRHGWRRSRTRIRCRQTVTRRPRPRPLDRRKKTRPNRDWKRRGRSPVPPVRTVNPRNCRPGPPRNPTRSGGRSKN